MIMFVSQFYNKILWQSDQYMNQSIPAAVVMIILINNQLYIFFPRLFHLQQASPRTGIHSVLYNRNSA